MRDAVVVSAHGVCKDNGTLAARATYAAWFGKECEYVNDHNVVPARESQKSNAAALYAVKRELFTYPYDMGHMEYHCNILNYEKGGYFAATRDILPSHVTFKTFKTFIL